MPQLRELITRGADSLPVIKALPTGPRAVKLSAGDCQALCKLIGLTYLKGYESRVLEYTITNETPDRYGDIVRAAGVDLTNFKREPVVHLAHDTHRFPVANSLKTWYDPNSKAVKSWALFADDRVDRDGLSETAFRFASNGFMKGASVGFLPKDAYSPVDNEEREAIGLGEHGKEYKTCELLEYSICSVPCNPDALTQMSRSLKSYEALIKEMGMHDCRKCGHKCHPKKESNMPQKVTKAIDPAQLAMGKEVEKEHAATVKAIRDSIKEGKVTLTDEAIYELIAKDHLNEQADYYTMLKEAEEGEEPEGEKPAEEPEAEKPEGEEPEGEDDGMKCHKETHARLQELRDELRAHKDASESMHGECKVTLEALQEAIKAFGKPDDEPEKPEDGEEEPGVGDDSKSFYSAVLTGISSFRKTIK